MIVVSEDSAAPAAVTSSKEAIMTCLHRGNPFTRGVSHSRRRTLDVLRIFADMDTAAMAGRVPHLVICGAGPGLSWEGLGGYLRCLGVSSNSGL